MRDSDVGRRFFAWPIVIGAGLVGIGLGLVDRYCPVLELARSLKRK